MTIDLPKSANHLPLPELAIDVSSLANVVELRRSLRAKGYSRTKVAGCVDFVVGIHQGDDDTAAPARAEYRRMLADLLSPPGGQPPIIHVAPESRRAA